MKSNKQNPITFFRKSFEDREKRIKSSMKKYAKGGPGDPPGTATTTTGTTTAATEKTEEQKAAEAKAAAQAKARALGSMTGKQYRQEKRGHKRAAKLERIANGTQGERANAIITAIGNAANAANTIMQTTGQAKETFGKHKRGGTIVKKKMAEGGTATNKKSSVSDTGMRIRSASPIGQAKRGGATKAAKFAALAPPYNKATAADRIAGAKKNKRK